MPASEHELLHRANAISLVSIVMLSCFAFTAIPANQPAGGAGTATVLLLVASLREWALRAPAQRVRQSLQIIFVCSIIMITAVGYLTGSWRSNAPYMMALMILCVGHTLGIRQMVIWTGVAAAASLTMMIAGSILDPPVVQPVTLLGSITRTLLFMLGVLALGAAARRVADERATQLRALNQNLEIRVDESTEALEIELVEREKAETEIEELSTQVAKASQLAGIADVATGVLHNVGNVLNSANVSICMLNRSLKGSKTGTLKQLVELIQEHREDLPDFLENDKRGQQVIPFLIQLSKRLDHERTINLDEVTKLEGSVNHIKDIVSSQQSLAKTSYGTFRLVCVMELVEEARRISLSEASYLEHQVLNEYDDLPDITMDPTRVLQILVNLMNNAKQAVRDSEADVRRVTVRVYPADSNPDNSRPRVAIEVKDTGVGISQENLQKLFVHGFTTKADGHGFGLHSAIAAAKDMEGCLSAESEGEGLGAQFTFELPINS